MAVLDVVKNCVDKKCVVSGGLKKDGCRVIMTNAPSPRLIVDFDKPNSPLAATEKRCDYLLTAKGSNGFDWVAVHELKRGRLHANEVVRQLRAGATAAEKLVPPGKKFSFEPLPNPATRPNTRE